MICNHKLGTLTYQTFFKVMISHDKRVAVLPNSFSLFPFFLFLFSLRVGPSFFLSVGPSFTEVWPFLEFCFDSGEGQLWNHT